MADWIVGYQEGRQVLPMRGKIGFEDDALLIPGYDFPGEVARRIHHGRAIVDLDDPALGQVIDPIQTRLHGGTGRDVQTVVITGRPVMAYWVIRSVAETASSARTRQRVDGRVARCPERTLEHLAVGEIGRLSPMINAGGL